MKTYQAFVAELKEAEGYSEKLYQDTEGKWTIGYGYNIEDRGLPKPVLEMLFLEDVKNAEIDVERWLGSQAPELTPARYWALVELAFNLGLTKLRKFVETRKAILAQDWERAANEILDSKPGRGEQGKGLKARYERIAREVRNG